MRKAALLVALASCATPDPGGAGQFCTEYATAVCKRLVRCHAAVEGELDACVALQRTLQCRLWEPSVRKGFQMLDLPNARACLARLTASACGDRFFDDCAVRGPAARTGDPCVQTLDCTNPNDLCSGPPCGETCRRTGGKDEPCRSSGRCDPGLACVGGACEPAPTLGSSCLDAGCEGLPCDQVTRRCGVFTGDLPPGTVCTGHLQLCQIASRCDGARIDPDGGIGTTGLCVLPAIADRCQVGASADRACPQYAFCAGPADGGLGECAATIAGSPCSVNECTFPLTCGGNRDAGFRCEALRPAGASCTDNRQCDDALGCVGGTCVPLGATAGASCVFEAGCQLPFLCLKGKCVHGGKADEPCVDAACISGACVQGLCTAEPAKAACP